MYNSILRSSHFTITENTKVLMISQLAAVLINIILNYVLIPKFGIIGATIATTSTHFLSLLVLIYFLCKVRKFFIFN